MKILSHEESNYYIKENLNLLFFITFLKVFFIKYINISENNNNLKDNSYENILNEEKFNLTPSLVYFPINYIWLYGG